MDILNTISLKSNSCFKLNFNGGSLTSDAGLLMIYDFILSQRIDVNLLNKFNGKANCVLEVLIRTIDKGDYRIIHKKCSSYCETVSIEPLSSSEFSFRSIMFNAERKNNMFTMLADDFFILHRARLASKS